MQRLASLLEAAEAARVKQLALKLQQDLIEASDALLDVKLKPNNRSSWIVIKLDVTCEVNNTSASYEIQTRQNNKCWITDSANMLLFLPEEEQRAVTDICKKLAFIDAALCGKYRSIVSELEYNALRSGRLLLKASGKYYRVANACMGANLKVGLYLAVTPASTVAYRKVYLLQVNGFTSKSESSKKYESVKEMMTAYKTQSFNGLYGGMLIDAKDLGQQRDFGLSLAVNSIYSPIGDQLSFFAVDEVHV